MPFLIIIPIIFIIILIIHFKKPRTRGQFGEDRVKRVIGRTVKNKQYVIHNLTLENEGKTSQIDHVVINPRGVFVIETKNYSGEIYGSENQREWTQVLAYGKVKNKLYNPLKQNATHVYNVKKIVGRLPICSLVVFVQNNTHYIEANNVIPLSALKSILQRGENLLSAEQMQIAYEALLSSKTKVSTKKHVRNIQKQQRNLQRGICPRCGGHLVFRNGEYGTFLGCSNYPTCRFIKKE